MSGRLKLLPDWVYYIPAIAIAVGIYIISDMPRAPMPDLGFRFADKLLHFIAYFIFAASIVLAFVRHSIRRSKIRMIVIVIGLMYAFSDELHQTYVPGRDGSTGDWLADAAGVIASVLFLNAQLNVFRKYI